MTVNISAVFVCIRSRGEREAEDEETSVTVRQGRKGDHSNFGTAAYLPYILSQFEVRNQCELNRKAQKRAVADARKKNRWRKRAKQRHKIKAAAGTDQDNFY